MHIECMHAYIYACINARSRTHTQTQIAAAMRGNKQGVTCPDKAVTGPDMRVTGRRDPSQAEPSSQDARGRQAVVSGRQAARLVRPLSTSRLSARSEVREVHKSPQCLDASAFKEGEEGEGHGQGAGGDRAGPHRARPSFGRSGGGGVGGRGGGGASRPDWVFDTASDARSLPTHKDPSSEFITNVTEDRDGGQGGRGGGGGEEVGSGRGDGVGESDGRGSLVGRRGAVERGRQGEEGAEGECGTGKGEGVAGAGGGRGRRRAATPSRASEAPFPTTDSSSAAGSHYQGYKDEGRGGRGEERGGMGVLGGKGTARTGGSERRRPSGGREGGDGDVFAGGGGGAGRGRGRGGHGEIERLQMEIVKMRQTFRQVL